MLIVIDIVLYISIPSHILIVSHPTQ